MKLLTVGLLLIAWYCDVFWLALALAVLYDLSENVFTWRER